MTIFKQFNTTLELVEEIANLESHIYCDEETTSEQFDKYLEEIEFFKVWGYDDRPALIEEFSNWMDRLCDDGDLHSEQVNQYCYIGKWS